MHEGSCYGNSLMHATIIRTGSRQPKLKFLLSWLVDEYRNFLCNLFWFKYLEPKYNSKIWEAVAKTAMLLTINKVGIFPLLSRESTDNC